MKTSINMRIFKSILFLLALVLVNVDANPLLHYTRDSRPERNEAAAADSIRSAPTEHYDQRQNGTENYRVKVDGLVFILAPADSLLLAGAALEPNFTSLLSEGQNKPKPKPEKEDLLKPIKPEKEDMSKSSHHDPVHAGSHKPALRISNLIAPFLNRLRHAQQARK